MSRIGVNENEAVGFVVVGHFFCNLWRTVAYPM